MRRAFDVDEISCEGVRVLVRSPRSAELPSTTVRNLVIEPILRIYVKQQYGCPVEMFMQMERRPERVNTIADTRALQLRSAVRRTKSSRKELMSESTAKDPCRMSLSGLNSAFRHLRPRRSSS